MRKTLWSPATSCVMDGEKARRVWGTQRGGSGAASGASMSSPRLFLGVQRRVPIRASQVAARIESACRHSTVEHRRALKIVMSRDEALRQYPQNEPM